MKCKIALKRTPESYIWKYLKVVPKHTDTLQTCIFSARFYTVFAWVQKGQGLQKTFQVAVAEFKLTGTPNLHDCISGARIHAWK